MTRFEAQERYSRFYIPIKQTQDCLVLYVLHDNYEGENLSGEWCFYPLDKFSDGSFEIPRLETPFISPLDTKLGKSLYELP